MQQTNYVFEGFGKFNVENLVDLEVSDSDKIGVTIEQPGSKKAITLTMRVPTSRSHKGTRRILKLELNGYQARELYAQLSKFYSNQP